MIVQVFGDDCRMALAISQAENGTRQCDRDNTGLNPDGTVDYGVFMVNGYWHRDKASAEQLKDCMTNIKVAKQIYDHWKQKPNHTGWEPWSVYKSGKYKQYVRI